jgi:hypothetical protein
MVVVLEQEAFITCRDMNGQCYIGQPWVNAVAVYTHMRELIRERQERVESCGIE